MDAKQIFRIYIDATLAELTYTGAKFRTETNPETLMTSVTIEGKEKPMFVFSEVGPSDESVHLHHDLQVSVKEVFPDILSDEGLPIKGATNWKKVN